MKKNLLKLTVCLMFLFSGVLAVFAGCSGGDKLTIGLWVNNSNERANNVKIFDAFTAETGIKVEPVIISSADYGDEVPRMYSGNTLPDLIWVGDGYMPMLANNGMIEDLKEYIEADADFDRTKYFDGALDFCSYNGKLYGLPRDVGVQVMALNLGIMGNTPLPDKDWTWEDMLSLAEHMTVKQGDKITQYGVGWVDYKSLIYANGGTLFKDNGTTATFNDPATVKALQFYADLANDYKVLPDATASQDVGNAFTGKKAAMVIAGPWDFANLNKLKIDFDIRPIPKGPDGAGTQKLSGLAIGINSKSSRKEDAYKLLKFLCYGETAQKMQAENGIAMPSIESIARSASFTESNMAPKSIDIYFEALENTFIEYRFEKEMAAMAEFADWLYEIWNQLPSHPVTPVSELANDMNTAIQGVLNG